MHKNNTNPMTPLDHPPSNRRLSRLSDLDREVVRELCDLHPWEMGQLCQSVGLNKSAFSNFLTGRRHLPQKHAAQFLRQLGLSVTGEVDKRHCFYFVVGPGLQKLALQWIDKLFPQGGKLFTLAQGARSLESAGGLDRDNALLGVAFVGLETVAVVRDEVNFGDFTWITGQWERLGPLLDAQSLLDENHLPDKSTVYAAIEGVQADDQQVLADIRRVAQNAGLSGGQVLELIQRAVGGRAVKTAELIKAEQAADKF